MKSLLLEEHASKSLLEEPEQNRVHASHGGASRVHRPFRSLLFWAVGLGLSFAGGWWFANARQLESTKLDLPPATESKIDEAIKITVQPVTFRSVPRIVEAVGTIHGYEELSISAKIEGRVTRIFHDLADRVEPGKLLLEIDRTDAQLAVDQAERSLQAELAKWGFKHVPKETEDFSTLPTVVSAKLKADLAQSRLQRLLPLYSAKAVALEDLEQAKSDAKVTESEWNNQLLMASSAAATARLKEADLAIARQRLRETEIKVPTPSTLGPSSETQYSVSARMVSEGMMVRPGMELFRLVLGRTLKLRLSLPEVHSSLIAEGQSVEVRTSTTKQSVAGRVSRISPSIDPSTRTFQLEVEVPNEDMRLKPGGFARASILVGTDQDVPTIPAVGLDSFAGVNKIFLIHEGHAKEVQVKVGDQNEDWIEIVSPAIPIGSVVATSAQRLLSDGLPVMIRNNGAEPTTPPSSSTSKPISTQTSGVEQ